MAELAEFGISFTNMTDPTELLKFIEKMLQNGLMFELKNQNNKRLTNRGFNCMSVKNALEDVVESLGFGVCFINSRNVFYVANGLTWFKIKGNRVFSFEVEITYGNRFISASSKNYKRDRFSSISFPNDLVEAFNADRCRIPTVKLSNFVTFGDKNFDIPPIILPKWAVIAYCNPKYASEAFVETNVVVDDTVATAIMNVFEHNIKPKRLTEKQLWMFDGIYNFLAN